MGADPRGWHLTNLVIHLCAVLLAWALARRALSRAGLASPGAPALAAAAIFALHPLQAESVAYLTQRAESLASALYLAGLLLLLARDGPSVPGRRVGLLAGATFTMALGLWVKPIVATLPAAWLLTSALLPAPDERGWPVSRRLRTRLLPSTPLFGLAAVAAWLELRGTSGALHAGWEVPGLDPLAYLATQCRVIPTYVRLALWPVGQSADWHFPPSAGFGDAWALLGAAFLAGLVAMAFLAARRAERLGGDRAAALRLAAFGPLFFLLCLTPSSSVVPLHDVLAEHRPYLGLLGLALAVVAAVTVALRTRLPARHAARWGAAGILALGALLGAATAVRASTWASSLALWSDVVQKGPGKARGHANLGVALAARGRQGEAVESYRRAARIVDDDTVPDDLLLANLVDALTGLGRVEEARREVDAALERSPDAPAPLGLLALVEFVAGRPDAAEAAAVRALAVDPGNGMALKYLGLVRSRRGDWAGARGFLRGAAEANQADTMVQWELGRAEEATGNVAGACAAYLRAAREPGLAARAARAARAFEALGCK